MGIVHYCILRNFAEELFGWLADIQAQCQTESRVNSCQISWWHYFTISRKSTYTTFQKFCHWWINPASNCILLQTCNKLHCNHEASGYAVCVCGLCIILSAAYNQIWIHQYQLLQVLDQSAKYTSVQYFQLCSTIHQNYTEEHGNIMDSLQSGQHSGFHTRSESLARF